LVGETPGFLLQPLRHIKSRQVVPAGAGRDGFDDPLVDIEPVVASCRQGAVSGDAAGQIMPDLVGKGTPPAVGIFRIISESRIATNNAAAIALIGQGG